MNYGNIRKFIDENRDRIDFGTSEEGCSDLWIQKAQERLSVRFPPSYVWWLKNYGGGEIDGDEVFSIYEMDFDTVIGGDIVYINELARKNGFVKDNELILLHSDLGEDYCFDLSQIDEDGESPVLKYPPMKKYADNFFDFLVKRLED